MKKAMKAVQRSYQRAPLKKFVKTQKAKPVPNRATAMRHTIVKPGGKA